MKCPHCDVHIHEDWVKNQLLWRRGPTKWDVYVAQCSNCSDFILNLESPSGGIRLIEPRNYSRGPISQHVPLNIVDDYIEACAVFPLSPKASAALSRRCLQNILNANGYTGKDLAKQVDAVLSETDARKAISLSLHDTIDAIRNFGNFSAHPIDDKTTLQIIDVEPEEAEWCLEILEEMFEHFYEKPAIAAGKKAALNAKLTAAGKPLAK